MSAAGIKMYQVEHDLPGHVKYNTKSTSGIAAGGEDIFANKKFENLWFHTPSLEVILKKQNVKNELVQ